METVEGVMIVRSLETDEGVMILALISSEHRKDNYSNLLLY